MIIERYAAEFITFVEVSTVSPRGFQLRESLLFTEDANNNLPQRSIDDLLIFNERLTLNKIVNLNFSETLSFTEVSSPRTFIFALDEFLVFLEYPSGFVGPSISETLIFSETLTAFVNKPNSDTLDFTETLVLTKIKNLLFTETLSFTEGLNFYKPSKNFIINPETVVNSDVSFQYGSRTLSWKKYVFGNSENVNYSRINRKSAGGDLIVASASNNSITTLAFTLRMLTCDELEAIQSFLHDTVGQEIIFTDHESISWTGIITTPNSPKVQTGRNTYSLSLEFQGVRT